MSLKGWSRGEKNGVDISARVYYLWSAWETKEKEKKEKVESQAKLRSGKGPTSELEDRASS